MAVRFTLVGLGESLFDIFGTEQRLGGAPLNVVVHAHAMLQAHQLGQAVLVSRTGQDALSHELINQLRERGVDTSWIQSDPDKPTGRVFVKTDDDGDVLGYDIALNAAWDVMQWDPELETLAQQCDALTFGSLAQRSMQSRSTIHRFVSEARRAIKLFDVNLRESSGQKFYDRATLRKGCELATLVKLNHEELEEVAELLGVEADAQVIRKTFDLEAVVFTRGAKGSAAYTAKGLVEGEPASADPTEGADSVGAGDSCSAAVLVGRLMGKPWPATLTYANRVAAYVVGQPGGTPRLPEELLKAV